MNENELNIQWSFKKEKKYIKRKKNAIWIKRFDRKFIFYQIFKILNIIILMYNMVIGYIVIGQ